MNDFLYLYKDLFFYKGDQYSQKMATTANTYSNFLVPVRLVSHSMGYVYLHTDRI